LTTTEHGGPGWAPAAGLCLATSPDSWGIWFPADDRQMRYGRFLDEVAAAGYGWVELGPYGYLPTDPGVLRGELERRGLRASGGLTSGALHRPDDWDQMLGVVRDVAALTAAMGAHHLVFIPPSYRDLKSGAYSESPELTDGQRASVYAAANRLGRILLDDYDVRLCLHSHADSHIQTQQEIERFLAGTDPGLVWLCLDTGHVAYGGGDNIDLIRRFGDRIGYVHLKQVNPELLRQAREQSLPFGEAVRRGVVVELPAGIPDAAAVVAELDLLGVPMFVIAEQDLYPCAADVPLPMAVAAREFLNGCGLSAWTEG
jgi:sugar phosphate isomerase/epimerase